MSALLTQFKHAEKQLSGLLNAIPDLRQSLDHQLHNYFSVLPENSRTDQLYITYELPPEPGQMAKLVSHSFFELIKHTHISGYVPTYVAAPARVYSDDYTLDEQHLIPGISITQVEAFVRYASHNLKSCVTNALDHFWSTPRFDLENTGPKTWLSAFLRTLISTEAQLRYADKTLSASSHAAITQVLAYTTHQARIDSGSSHPLSVYSVALKGPVSALDAPLQGLFVIADDTFSQLNHATPDFTPAPKSPQLLDAHKVVVYIPGSGLEEFESLHALSLELQARLEDQYQAQGLLNYVQLKDRERAQHLFSIGYREITADVFDTYTAELIDKQHHNIDHAWRAAKAQSIPADLEVLASQVEQALSVSFTLSPANILQARYTRLLESQMPTWLTTASDESKQQWRRSVERLNNEMRISQTTEPTYLLDNGHKTTLLSYARSQLKKQIKSDHQLDVDPDQIFISTTRAHNTSPGFNPIATSGYVAGVSVHRTGPTITYSNSQRSLTELALENVGLLDLEFALTARVRDASGKHHPTLTTVYLKTLVRTLDIGRRYKNLLYNTLVDPTSAQVAWRKERYIAVTMAQLRLDILEAQLAGTLSSEEAARVDAVLTHPVENTRPEVNGKHIKVHLLTLRDKPMLGVFVITAYNSPDLICYTPNAPDKVWFRKANSLDNLAAAFSNKALHHYVLQRVSSAAQPYIKHSLNNGLSYFDSGLQLITTHFLQAYYDEDAAFVIRNADEQSTSTFEANVQTAKDVALTVIDVMSFVLPIKILLPLTLARFMYSISEGFDALARSDKEEAQLHFLGSLSHLTDGVSDFAGSGVFGKGIRLRPKATLQTLNPKIASTRAITHMRLRASDDYGIGVYEYTEPTSGQTRYYLVDPQGNVYRSQYDNLNDTWRIVDERQPEAIYNTPVSQLAEGRWGISSTTPTVSITLRELIEKATVSVDLSGRSPDAKGVYRVNHFNYIQQNGIAFEVQYGWLGRHLYLILPGSSRSAHTTYKVRRSEDYGYWEVKRRLDDSTKLWEPLSLSNVRHSSIPSRASSIIYTDYDMSVEHANDLREITANKEINFSEEVYYFGSQWELARAHAVDVQRAMFTDALKFFKKHTPTPRIMPPNMPLHASHEVMLKTFYDTYPGIVIAEAHSDTTSKQFIIENMDFLVRSKVKVLYMEHLQTDLHQRFLDVFSKTGKMAPALHDFLKHLDLGNRIDKTSIYNYRHLVHLAQRRGIEVKALDCVASYNSKGLSHSDSISPRHELMNYGAHQIISKNIAKEGQHRWIALVGNTHANHYKGVPGLAELQNSVGLRIEDVSPGTGLEIRPDVGFIDYPSIRNSETSLLKNDWLLRIETPNKAPHPPTLANPHMLEKLHKPGMYTFENVPVLGPFLVYRSSDEKLLKTPFIFETRGTFHINMPNRPLIHKKSYIALNHLFIDLAAIGMQRG